MAILKFPPLKNASPEGLLAIGGDLETESLQLAYSNGIFPWPTEGYPLLWFAPPERAILRFEDFKIPRRLRQELKRLKFTFTVDENFGAVIRNCAAGLTRQSIGTWITPEIIAAYEAFHRAGYAHSFECYNASGELAGGMYGVSLGGMFAGESMFFLESGASKAALIFAVEFLRERGATWMDVQQLTPLLKSFGAKLEKREVFMKMLKKAIQGPGLFKLSSPRRRGSRFDGSGPPPSRG